MDCLNCGNYATKVYVNDEGTPCFLCASCADAWELGHWYGQNYPETALARIDEYCGAEDTDPASPSITSCPNPSTNPCHEHHS